MTTRSLEVIADGREVRAHHRAAADRRLGDGGAQPLAPQEGQDSHGRVAVQTGQLRRRFKVHQRQARPQFARDGARHPALGGRTVKGDHDAFKAGGEAGQEGPLKSAIRTTGVSPIDGKGEGRARRPLLPGLARGRGSRLQVGPAWDYLVFLGVELFHQTAAVGEGHHPGVQPLEETLQHRLGHLVGGHRHRGEVERGHYRAPRLPQSGETQRRGQRLMDVYHVELAPQHELLQTGGDVHRQSQVGHPTVQPDGEAEAHRYHRDGVLGSERSGPRRGQQ
jgi:hypothetical protein